MELGNVFSRRIFLQGAGAGAAGTTASASPDAGARLTVDDKGVIQVQTKTLEARIEKGFLTSLKSRSTAPRPTPCN